MASIVPGFEYDIFISYRQKDNKGEHWVTEFVSALNAELEAAFKESISVYFDSNPKDGLSATHDVDDSLKEKLKCAIFIPIISQTYCDPKSFAWRDEFLAFKQLATSDKLGLKIKLQNGNVASRILPVRIHNLDVSDKQLLESELGPLRAVDFVYNSGSASRPLLHNELEPKSNLEKTYYRDQMASIVKAIKELLNAMQNPTGSKANSAEQANAVQPSAKKKISLVAAAVLIIGLMGFLSYNYLGFGKKLLQERERSIAVLPFENMNKDSTQDYFSSGMSEDILNHLVKIADLQVKSRTSTLQYKGTTKTASQIGEELSVANIVEGSVRRVGDKVRIVVQLIDAQTDLHLWSETYDRDFKDVLNLQSEIAVEIAKALQAQLTTSERLDIEKETTQNATAYDYYLKAREFSRRGNFTRSELESALALVNQAIAMDKKFSKAYAFKASLWFDLSSYGLPQATWYDSATQSADKAITLDATSPDGYLIKSLMHRYLGKIVKADEELQKAYDIAPKNPEVMFPYGYFLLRSGKEEGADMVLKANENKFSLKDAEYYAVLSNAYSASGDHQSWVKLLKTAKKLNPGASYIYYNLAYAYRRLGQYELAISELKEADNINPNTTWTTDNIAWTYFYNKDYVNAAKYWSKYPELEKAIKDTSQIIPFRHRLAFVYYKMGRKQDGEKLVREDLKFRERHLKQDRSLGVWSNFGSLYYDLAVDHALLGNNKLAVQCLDSAFSYQFYYNEEGYGNDPAFETLKDREDFKQVANRQRDFFQFTGKAFSNALNRSQASNELKGLLDK